MRRDPQNRVYPLLDIIPVPCNDDFAIIVMPILRLFSSPVFRQLREVVEAMRQFLEIKFRHSTHNFVLKIRRRDACTLNLMMDATPDLPNGFHFSRSWTTDGVQSNYGVPWRSRSSPVNYYFIDFGLARNHPNGIETARSVGSPYNPFPVDIYQLGNVFQVDGRSYFSQFAALMTKKEPGDRPSAHEALNHFEAICSSIPSFELDAPLSLIEHKDSDSDFELVLESGSLVFKYAPMIPCQIRILKPTCSIAVLRLARGI
ncbi:hypothetical protein C8R43DRAFT_1069958 [Mycena crocata]|nr:hypothetical protein C8R43DRAFT_1069958 [Mycena crocata]